MVVKVLPRSKKPGDFVFGPETTVVAVTRTAILTEEGPTWIHASRVKKVPLREPVAQDQEALTGADSPGLQQDPGVLTGAESPDPQRQDIEVLTGAESPDLQQQDIEVPEGADRPHLQPERTRGLHEDGYASEFWTMVALSFSTPTVIISPPC